MANLASHRLVIHGEPIMTTMGQGYDGVKTGTKSAVGACLVASGSKGGDHLTVVIDETRHR